MKLRKKIHVVLFSILMLLLISLFSTYEMTKRHYMGILQYFITQEIEADKRELIYPMEHATVYFSENRSRFKTILQEGVRALKQTPSMSSFELKKYLIDKYQLSPNEFEVFYVDTDYVIFDSTEPRDLNLDLSAVPKARELINQAVSSNEVVLPHMISRDSIDLQYKIFSYAKVNDSIVLDIGFIDTLTNQEIMENIGTGSSFIHSQMYGIHRDRFNQYYYLSMNRHFLKNDKNFFYQDKVYMKPSENSHPIKSVFFNGIDVIETTDDKYIVYTNLFEDINFNTEYESIIAKLEVDLSMVNAYLDKISLIFIVVALVAIAIWVIIFFMIDRSLVKPLNYMGKQIDAGQRITPDLVSSNSELRIIAQKYNALLSNLSIEIDKNQQLAMQDSLTKAYNRLSFDIKISELIDAYHHTGNGFVMLLFDIDNFKQINDTFGHVVGDEVLVKLSQITMANIRVEDLFYRIGGEEFVVLFPKTELENAQGLGERVREQIEAGFTELRADSVTISGGIATIRQGDNFTSFYNRADKLLYHAKTHGKNKICVS